MLDREPYQIPPYKVPLIDLEMALGFEKTRIKACMRYELWDPHQPSPPHLDLHGEDLQLESICYLSHPNEKILWDRTPQGLRIYNPPPHFMLETVVIVSPSQNTKLLGLYRSQDLLLTQCEPEGFRRITFFLDRPDVLSRFRVTLEGDPQIFPTMLSNGQKIFEARHGARWRVTWDDPYPKPSYLFAVAAGKFDIKQLEHVSSLSGRKIRLEAYVPEGRSEEAEYALESLSKAMRWEEDHYGLEYELEDYKIVATYDFNAGAMENKGLNVFNASLVLASPKVATDQNYLNIFRVVAHEYLHNYSGNRVTLRDWFNLSLKEGLTVFRESDCLKSFYDPAYVRAMNYLVLKKSQWIEDSSPTRHPVYPMRAAAMENLFSATIYEKGAEIIAMLSHLIGERNFRKKIRDYFQKFDGQAVTIYDFLDCVLEKSILVQHPAFQLDQFKVWYEQAGTPEIKATWKKEKKGRYLLCLQQRVYGLGTLSSQKAKPWLIPLRIECISKEGKTILIGREVFVSGPTSLFVNPEGWVFLFLTQEEETWIFETPFPLDLTVSLNDGFVSPIHVSFDLSPPEKLQIINLQQDGFQKFLGFSGLWDLGFQEAYQKSDYSLILQVAQSLLQNLKMGKISPLLLSIYWDWPSGVEAAIRVKPIDPNKWFEVLKKSYHIIVQEFGDILWESYQRIPDHKDEIRFEPKFMGDRQLRYQLLRLLCFGGFQPAWSEALDIFLVAKNLTDQFSSFQILMQNEQFRDEISRKAWERWSKEPLNYSRYLKAFSSFEIYPESFKDVKKLYDTSIEKTNPNQVYSLIGMFGDSLVHAYQSQERISWLISVIEELDRINPIITSRLAQSLAIIVDLIDELRLPALKKLREVRSNLSRESADVIGRIIDSAHHR